MWILAPLYIKMESTTQAEMPDSDNYVVDIIYSIYTDETRSHRIATLNYQLTDVIAENLTFTFIYTSLMALFPWATYVE